MRLRVITSSLLAALAAIAGHATASAAADPPPGFSPAMLGPASNRGHTSVLCRPREWNFSRSGLVAYNDVFVRGYSECIRIRQAGFRVIRARTGSAFGAYPDVFVGCEYGVCSKAPLPSKPVRDLTRLTMTLYTRFDSVVGNDATDWWFDRANPGRSTGHPNGTELMVWLAWRGLPMSGGYEVRLGGWSWYIEHWLAVSDHKTWQYVQVRWLGRHLHPSLRLNMLPMLRYVEHQGWLKPSWYPSSLDAGFEIVRGGAGDRILKYAVDIRPRAAASDATAPATARRIAAAGEAAG